MEIKSHKSYKKRLKESLREFRDKAIAHKLIREMRELSVELEDISKLLDAAINLFEIFSFYPLDFYDQEITENSFVAEQLTVQKQSKQLLNLLWFSVSVKYSYGFPDPQVLPIIVVDRYLDYFTTIMEDRLWEVLAKPVSRCRNRSGLSMNAVRAA